MIYLDNSATSEISKEALNTSSVDLFKEMSEQDLKKFKMRIKELLGTDLEPIITSGSSEANNLAIKGICSRSSKKEIITTHLEHSSINETLKYLETIGFTVRYIPIKDTVLDLEELPNMINSNTALITVCLVNSETGTLNNINKIGEIAHEHGVVFHSDLTQGIGKIPISLANVDLASISSHKFHGPKGVGVLLKNKSINLTPLIYGKRSYNLGIVKGMIKALEISLNRIDANYRKVEELKCYFKKNIKYLPDIIINESKENIPHILNISVLKYKPETFLHYLEMYDIYISTKSACSSGDYSEAVLAITNDMKRAETSVRISISEENSKQQLDKVIELIKRSEHGK